MIVTRKQFLNALATVGMLSQVPIATAAAQSLPDNPPAFDYFSNQSLPSVQGVAYANVEKASPERSTETTPESIAEPRPEPAPEQSDAMPLAPAAGHRLPTVCQCSQCLTLRQKMAANKRAHIAHMQATHLGYAANTCVQPFGSAVNYARQIQTLQGVTESSTLYHYDFFPSSSERAALLTVYGQDRLRIIAARASLAGAPIRIEAALENPALDQERRLAVLEFSQSENLNIPPEWVVLVRNPRSTLGIESGLMYQNRLQSVQSGGRTGGAGGGADQTGGGSASGGAGAATGGGAGMP